MSGTFIFIIIFIGKDSARVCYTNYFYQYFNNIEFLKYPLLFSNSNAHFKHPPFLLFDIMIIYKFDPSVLFYSSLEKMAWKKSRQYIGKKTINVEAGYVL